MSSLSKKALINIKVTKLKNCFEVKNGFISSDSIKEIEFDLDENNNLITINNENNKIIQLVKKYW